MLFFLCIGSEETQSILDLQASPGEFFRNIFHKSFIVTTSFVYLSPYPSY